MRNFLLIATVLPAFVFAEERILDEQENHFRTSTDYRIAPKVNPITGEYTEAEVDLVVAGAQPLSVRRFYNHFSPYEPRYASWCYNPESFCTANLEWKGQETFIAIGDGDGSISALKRSPSNGLHFIFQPSKGFCTFAASGQSHPLNTHVEYWHLAYHKDKHKFQYKGKITDGSGRERTFISPMHRWREETHWKEKRGNFFSGSETNWTVYPNTWTPYQLEIEEERLPNGNILHYDYEIWKTAKQEYPRPRLLVAIKAYNHNKTKELGSIAFDYKRIKDGDVGGILIKGSDGREVFIQHTGGKGTTPLLLAFARRSGQPLLAYDYARGTLNRVEKPEGRILTTEYQAGKVSAQYASVGPNGEMCPIGRYEYRERATVVHDAEGHKTIYRYDENKKMTAFEVYQGDSPYRTDRFTWDAKTGNLLSKSIEENGKIIQATDYQFDKNQNVILEKVSDSKEWRLIRRTFSEDGFNLKLTETDRDHKLTRYNYVPNTNLLASELIYEDQVIRKRTFHFYNDCAVCMRTIIDDGCTENADDLQGVSFRKIIDITPKESSPCYGLPEKVEEKTITAAGQEISLNKVIYTYTPFGKVLKEEHYDAEGVYCYSICNQYDAMERLIATQDTLGHQTTFSYDINNNLIAISGPKPGQRKEIVYDQANRPVQISDWQVDGTLLTTQKKYNKLGLVVEETDASNHTTRFEYDSLGRVIASIHPDGAIERREYDLLGNITKEIDAEGYETRKTYNTFGQVVSIYHSDGAEEHFTYNSTGTLHSYQDKNGAITTYTYDIFDHPLCTEMHSSAGQLLKRVEATWSPFFQLTETNADLKSSYRYDYAGRKIEEQRAYQQFYYLYDSLGRLSEVKEGDISTIRTYDNCDHILETRTEKNGSTQARESYCYDEVGNCIGVTHSQGSTKTVFNTYGKPVRYTDLLGFTTQYSYSYDSSFTQTTISPKNITTLLTHDSRGREAQYIKKNARGEIIQQYENHYDKNGNRIAISHSVFSDTVKNVMHQWEYGPMGRVERFLEAGIKETKYLYDYRGRVQTIIKPNGCQLRHEYDELGRLSRFYSQDFDYGYTYDQQDRVISIEDHLSHTITRSLYDPLGNLLKETLANGLTLANQYDQKGKRTRLILPDASTIEYTYDGMYLSQVKRGPYTHTYSKRNLEGRWMAAILPGGLGEVSIERDALGRYTSFRSLYFTEIYPKNAYDAHGNLLSYAYQDCKGESQCSYSYDDLDQLIVEKEHTYRFDSLYNRIQKDGGQCQIDSLCQLNHDGQSSYTYDSCGNLIADGERKYFYDSLDRLIAVETGTKRVEYSYDALHRRLSKTIFEKGKRTAHIRYIWDGNHEIGSVDEKNRVQELRVLGEGLGAEIGSAVLCELNGKPYVPISDHRGNIVTLIDLQRKKPVESYRFSAFGEEALIYTVIYPVSLQKLCPWRFCSKRVDEETGFSCFGRRFYHPKIGRWLTQDPDGFGGGVNLYAYVSNNPLNRLDLYGLKDYLPFFEDDILDFPGLSYGTLLKAGRITPQFYGFENGFKNQSGVYDLKANYNRLDLPTHRAIFFINGMNNNMEGFMGHLLHISDLSGGYNITGTYNATHGLLVDGTECAMGLFYGTRTTPVAHIHKMWDGFFDQAPVDALALHFCTSQGTILTKLALKDYPEERRNRLRVIGVAPADYIPRTLCHSVRHYVTDHWYRDPIPRINFIGRRRCIDTIQYLPSHPEADRLDHSFSSRTFERVIQDEITDYYDLTVGK